MFLALEKEGLYVVYFFHYAQLYAKEVWLDELILRWTGLPLALDR
jgi:hypothetical protein